MLSKSLDSSKLDKRKKTMVLIWERPALTGGTIDAVLVTTSRVSCPS